MFISRRRFLGLLRAALCRGRASRLGPAAALCLLTSLGLSRLASADTTTAQEHVDPHFFAGLAYLKDPNGARTEEALREFRTSYALSRHWQVLVHLGDCARQLERDGEAIQSYRNYLTLGGDQVALEQREQLESRLATLEVSVVKLDLVVNPPQASLIDERIPVRGSVVTNWYSSIGAAGALGIHPGRHRLRVTAEGYRPAVLEFEAEPGSQLSHAFRLTPEPEEPACTLSRQATAAAHAPTPLSPPNSAAPVDANTRLSPSTHSAAVAGLASAGVLAATGLTTGILAVSARDRYEHLSDRNELAGAAEARRTGEQLNVLTDVLLGAALLVGGTSAYFYLDGQRRPGADTGGSLRVLPDASKHGGSLRVHGSF